MGRNKQKNKDNPDRKLSKRQQRELERAERLRSKQKKILYSFIAIALVFSTILSFYFYQKHEYKKQHTYRSIELEPSTPFPNVPLRASGLNRSYQYHPQNNALSIIDANLECAEGLHNSVEFSPEKCKTFLKKSADYVKSETERNMFQFVRNPGDFNDSEAYFRMLVLVTVLEKDFEFQYTPCLILNDLYKENSTRFFRDAKDIFIHGLVYEKTGSCSSFPVITVAVGRLLGYPLKLVASKGHLFLRWEDEKERFNIDHCGNGMKTPPDSYYLTWPCKLTEKEIKNGYYLKSMTPEQEKASFLQNRGFCLLEHERYNEAVKAFSQAYELNPQGTFLKELAEHSENIRLKKIAFLKKQQEEINTATMLSSGVFTMQLNKHRRAKNIKKYKKTLSIEKEFETKQWEKQRLIAEEIKKLQGS